MDVMLKALYLGAKHCIPHMQRKQFGNIINIASVHSFLQEPNMLSIIHISEPTRNMINSVSVFWMKKK